MLDMGRWYLDIAGGRVDEMLPWGGEDHDVLGMLFGIIPTSSRELPEHAQEPEVSFEAGWFASDRGLIESPVVRMFQ